MVSTWSLRSILRSLSVLALLSLLWSLPVPTRPAMPASQRPPLLVSLGSQPPAPPPASIPRGDDRILILGLTQDRLRTDSIMVSEWDEVHHQARVLGVPRDIEITLPGIGVTKLVHAYATGGIGRARAAVVKLLDIPVAHYVVFSLPAMRHIVDLIGGVPIIVEKRMVYADRRQGLFINLQPGPQVLDGVRAEGYLRFRHDPEGDIGRIRRQQQFLRAALATMHRPQVWMRLPQIIEATRAEVDTDLTTSQLLGWLRRVDQLSPDAVSAYTIEGRPGLLWDNLARTHLDFWLPDTEDLRAKVRWLVTGVLLPIAGP